jgi:hypothetical protein
MEQNEERLTGFVTPCVETALYKTRYRKEIWKGRGNEEDDVSRYWMTLRK